MKKRYIYSAYLASAFFIVLYLILSFNIIISILITALVYVGGIFFFKDKDIRKYDPNAIMHYCYLISKIDNYTNVIKDKEVTKDIKDISTKSEKIVVMLEQKPDKITQVYNGFDFYLPQTIKILEEYVMLDKKDNKTDDEKKFYESINQTLDYIENEIDKLLENMNYTKMLDINASIEMFKKANSDIKEEKEGSDQHA